MFNNISEILSKFTTSQRVGVLIVLLIAGLLFTFGGKILDQTDKTDTVLLQRIQRLERSNSLIAKENDSLYSMLSASKLECANDIIQLKRQLLEDLGVLEKEMKKTSIVRQVDFTREPRTGGTSYSTSGQDTVMMMMSPAPVETQKIEIRKTPTDAMKTLKKLKSKLIEEVKTP